MSQHELFSVIESSIYMFGSHFENAQSGWKYQKAKHDLFELNYVIDGKQTLKLNDKDLIVNAGEAVIIAPGTIHQGNNFEKSSLKMFCFHFNISNLDFRSKIIKHIANMVFEKDSSVALASKKVSQNTVGCRHLNKNKAISEMKNEIVFLNYLITLEQDCNLMEQHNLPKYSEHEAQLAREVYDALGDFQNINLKFSDLCRNLNISATYGHRIFKKVYGITPYKYVEETRFSKSKMLLETEEKTVENIAYLLCFQSQASFSKQFKKWAGISPSEYRKQVQYEKHLANYLNY